MKKEEDFEANLAGEEGNQKRQGSVGLSEKKKEFLLPLQKKKKPLKDFGPNALNAILYTTSTDLRENLYVCPKCNYHHRIGSDEYYDIIFDNKEYEELFENIRAKIF